ncbi:NADP-dependent oxidoreductase [Aurantiacibacter aquimixticola]|uniref:NADP-dependent oxidoreductase n=1 Tax=Aurantiacibacter aquimixticola TaxID=1958945 RepID=A0A419RW76_9SPHN|nr:NADP-dependent oxidoreductase [Aurantiacibacter aquimixticola]RJY10017.1 NADP-dependent oxidoreductase [Aurantiacibacter aquimixticola]
MSEFQKVVLSREITGVPVAQDFAIEAMARPEIAEGELLVKNAFLSLDPYIGSRLKGRHMSGPAPKIGELIPGLAVGEVLESRAAGFAPGDHVVGESGWRTHCVMDAAAAQKVDAAIQPLSLHLGVCGMPGLTAWASAHHLAKVREGDRVLVSSATGPVGGTVGQLARIKGATKVVGLAGSDTKCRTVEREYGFDLCINYKDADWTDQLAAALPDGITVYHDNVGGDVLDAALANLADYGRVILCGLISQYNLPEGERPAGPNPGVYILKRAQLSGLVVYDYMAEQADYAARAFEWIESGDLRYVEDRAEGLAATPELFAKLMHGDNVGKTVVALGNG